MPLQVNWFGQSQP